VTARWRRRNGAAGAQTVGALVVGGDYQGLGIARSLGRRGIPVCVIDDEPSVARASKFVGRFVRVRDLRDARATVDVLVDVGTRFGLNGWVVYPTREETVAAISAHRDELQTLFRIATPDWESVQPAWDKRLTYRVGESLGMAMPRTWFPADEHELRALDLPWPVIVKPAIKEHFFYATRAKAWQANDRRQLLDAYCNATRTVGDPGEIIVQEVIPGGGDRQVAYCTFFKGGAPIAGMTVCRWRQHPSDYGRASTYVETVRLPELEQLSIRFLREIGYYGLAELEYKEDPRDGTYKLLDVNLRTWGYHTLGGAAGVDFPYLLYRDQTGLPVSPMTARTGVRWIRLTTDLPNAARDMRAGTVKLADYARTLRGVDVEAVFSARDPLPWIYELLLLPYLAVKRGL
jgi:D-aspartate ligase